MLPHVNPQKTGDFIVGCFTGLQAVSRVTSDRRDLGHRISVMWNHVLPSIVPASMLTWIETGEERIEKVAAAAAAAEAAEAAAATEAASDK